jgi:hypothetical protein
MQACGLVNAHVMSCFRYDEVGAPNEAATPMRSQWAPPPQPLVPAGKGEVL